MKEQEEAVTKLKLRPIPAEDEDITKAPWKTTVSKSIGPETRLVAVSATESTKATSTMASGALSEEDAPIESKITLEAHPFLTDIEQDAEALQAILVPRPLVPKTRIAADSATRATSNTGVPATASDAIMVAEDTATTGTRGQLCPGLRCL